MLILQCFDLCFVFDGLERRMFVFLRWKIDDVGRVFIFLTVVVIIVVVVIVNLQ